MPARKLRVEIFDAEGNRYTVSCEGHMTKEKILHLLDLIELMGGTTEGEVEWRSTSQTGTKFERMHALVKRNFPLDWFSSKDAQKICKQELRESFSLSTVSTYLARMVDRGFLMRKGAPDNRRYKVPPVPYQNEADIIKR